MYTNNEILVKSHMRGVPHITETRRHNYKVKNSLTPFWSHHNLNEPECDF